MERSKGERNSPPPRIRLQESPTLLRELYRIYSEKASAIADYSYASILLEKDLPAAAELLSTVTKGELAQYIALGRLLRDLGATHALRVSLRATPYRLLEDADSHAPVVAAQIIKDRLRDEKNALLTYRGLAKKVATERARNTLIALSEEEQDHIELLHAMLARLTQS